MHELYPGLQLLALIGNKDMASNESLSVLHGCSQPGLRVAGL